MKRLFGKFAVRFGAVLLLCSCGSTSTMMVGQPRPAISPDAVRVYDTPPRRFERIAIINSSSGPTWSFTTPGQTEDAISKLREEAAKVGANGVLIEAIDTASSGGSASVAADLEWAAAITAGMLLAEAAISED